MTTTRWKMTAGGLVLALGGLAAVAGVPASSCQPDHKAGSTALVPIPVVPAPTAVTRTAHQTPADAPATPAVPTPSEPAPAPVVSTPADLTLPVVTAEKKSEPKPAPKEDKVFELAVPAEEAKPAAVTPPILPSPEPKPVPVTPPQPASDPAPILPTPVRAEPTPAPVQPTTAPADPLLTTPPAPAPTVVEKKLKVLLQMGDDQPRFEVRDGDVVYLKVVCNKVDVKSPSDRGETMSTLRAAGHVTFVTPGGEGVCEELTVIPGTGQVVVSGRVSFKYNWGKVETTVSGDKMTFRLGSTPGAAPTPVHTVSHETR